MTNTKSDILEFLEQSGQTEPPPIFDCKVLDGAAIVHCLPTNTVSTFDDYADTIFIPYLENQLKDAKRLDLVWDSYFPDSLKESTREKRGKGERRKVSGPTKLPGNFQDFLRDNINKMELFHFLTSKIEKHSWCQDKDIYATSGPNVVSVGFSNPMETCNHEEADTRLIVHIFHALEQGQKSFLVRTVDTDVTVILIGTFHKMLAFQSLVDIWVAFGTGKSYRFYHINTIFESLGELRSKALPVFHAYSGCDTTSAFNGKAKKSAWQAWQSYEEVTETLEFLADHPFEQLELGDELFKKLERLTVILYDKTSALNSVNEARKKLFCEDNRSMDRLPPTQDALLQHVRRAVFQAGIWTTSTEAQQVVPSPAQYAWTKESDSWVPVWITTPEVSKACRELIKCSCKGDCSKCTCGKANLNCSQLC